MYTKFRINVSPDCSRYTKSSVQIDLIYLIFPRLGNNIVGRATVPICCTLALLCVERVRFRLNWLVHAGPGHNAGSQTTLHAAILTDAWLTRPHNLNHAPCTPCIYLSHHVFAVLASEHWCMYIAITRVCWPPFLILIRCVRTNEASGNEKIIGIIFLIILYFFVVNVCCSRVCLSLLSVMSAAYYSRTFNVADVCCRWPPAVPTLCPATTKLFSFGWWNHN